jgi:hypothetical protein
VIALKRLRVAETRTTWSRSWPYTQNTIEPAETVVGQASHGGSFYHAKRWRISRSIPRLCARGFHFIYNLDESLLTWFNSPSHLLFWADIAGQVTIGPNKGAAQRMRVMDRIDLPASSVPAVDSPKLQALNYAERGMFLPAVLQSAVKQTLSNNNPVGYYHRLAELVNDTDHLYFMEDGVMKRRPITGISVSQACVFTNAPTGGLFLPTERQTLQEFDPGGYRAYHRSGWVPSK